MLERLTDGKAALKRHTQLSSKTHGLAFLLVTYLSRDMTELVLEMYGRSS